MSTARRLVSGVVGAVIASGLVLVTGPSHSTPDNATTYDAIELQARTNLLVNDKGYNLPPGSSFNSISPSLNDDGDVAFGVQVVHDVDTGTDRPGLWFGRHGDGDIVHEGEASDRINPDASINNAGQVAFTLAPNGGFDNNLFVFDSDSGEVQQRHSLPVTPNSHSTPIIAADGTVVTRAGLGSSDGWLSMSSDNVGTLLASHNDVSGDPYYYLYSPTTNDAGQVAGKLGIDPDDYAPVEIRRFDADGESVRLLANFDADPASPYLSFDNSLAMNNDGTVAVIAKKTNGTKVLLRTDGTTTTEVVAAGDDQTIRSFDSFAPDINDADQIAFRGRDAEGQAIYVAAADGSLSRVIARGEQVDTDQGRGQVAQHNADNVFGGAPKINASGDVVFTAALTPADNDQAEWGTGVFVAYAGNEAPPVSGVLNGTVTDANTGDPVGDASVEAASSDGAVTSTTSASAGTYSLSLAPGNYVVTTSAPGLHDAQQEVTVAEGETVGLATELTSPLLESSPAEIRMSPKLWNDATETITVTNPGSAEMAWQANAKAKWLTISPAKGTLQPGESVDVTVVADRSGKSAGSYGSAVTVTSEDLDPVVTDVTMKVGRADAAIDVGGPAYTDKRKLHWLADRNLGNGDYGRVGSSKVQRTKKAIAGTKSDKLFRTRRVAKKLVYRVRDLPAGKYTLLLGFVEYHKVKPGQRLFNVHVDGVRVLHKYDVRRHAKPLRANLKKLTVRHKGNGDLVVKLRGVKGKPILSALRLREK